MARRKGIDAVTIRAVATALAVSPMALYRYIPSSEALRHATVALALTEVPIPSGQGSVADRLRDWAHATRRVVGRYPGLSEVCLTEWVAHRQGCRIMEGLLAAAADQTPRDEAQVAIANACFVYVFTRVTVERAVLAGGRRRKLPAVEAEPERFPRLVHLQAEFSTVNTDRHFAIGLEALLDGLLAPEHVR